MSLTGLKKFKMGKVLGSGTFATVCVATDMNTDLKYAMKVIDKSKCKGQEQHLVKEIAILKKANHKNIIKLYDCFETKDKVYLQMEMVKGGELFERIVKKGFYTEADAKSIVGNVLDAIQYLHGMNICHRDLKPENLLMADQSDKSEVKIADFGLSTVVNNTSMLATSCGTLTYVAPEVLKGKGYDGKSVDMWAIGVITYILLSGYPPFYAEDDAAIMELTLKGKFRYFSPDWDQISQEAKNFINALIVVDASKRITAADAFAHPWLANYNTEKRTAAGNQNIHQHVSDNLRKHFNARKKLRGAVEAIQFLRRLSGTDGLRLDSAVNSRNASPSHSGPPSPKATSKPDLVPNGLLEAAAAKLALDSTAVESSVEKSAQLTQ